MADKTEEPALLSRTPRGVLMREAQACKSCALTFPERRELLLSWLPNAEPFELPGATHLLHGEKPREMAKALATFYVRHPLDRGDYASASTPRHASVRKG